ncbi:hypothetical protein RB597_001932 [Gaeumannomyces tritici]
MSDPFSIIAGGCGLAVQIVDVGIKIKKLYEQFDGAPSSLRDTIDLIQLHVADLSPAIPIDDQADIPPQTAAVLAFSKAYCQKVLEELQGVAGELHAQLEKSQGRGSARRQFATLKIVLKKDVLAQHEARLARASGFLMQAKLSYIMTLVQQLRVEIRVPNAGALMGHPGTGKGRMLEAPDAGNGQEATAYATLKETRSSKRCSLSPGGMRSPRLLGSSRRIGLAQLTGCVEVHFPSRHCQCPRCPGATRGGYHAENDPFWLKVQLPQWICNLVIESSITHSTTGWLHHMTTYRSHNLTASTVIINTIRAGDIPKLRRLFQTRELGPRDLLSTARSCREVTLAAVAIMERQWDVLAFLLNHGADTGRLIILRNSTSRGPHPPSEKSDHRKRRMYSKPIGYSTPIVDFYLESRTGSRPEQILQAYKAVIESTLDENDLGAFFVDDREQSFKAALVDTVLQFEPCLWIIDQARQLLGGILDTSKPLRPKSYDIYLEVINEMN